MELFLAQVGDIFHTIRSASSFERRAFEKKWVLMGSAVESFFGAS